MLPIISPDSGLLMQRAFTFPLKKVVLISISATGTRRIVPSIITQVFIVLVPVNASSDIRSFLTTTVEQPVSRRTITFCCPTRPSAVGIDAVDSRSRQASAMNGNLQPQRSSTLSDSMALHIGPTSPPRLSDSLHTGVWYVLDTSDSLFSAPVQVVSAWLSGKQTVAPVDGYLSQTHGSSLKRVVGCLSSSRASGFFALNIRDLCTTGWRQVLSSYSRGPNAAGCRR